MTSDQPPPEPISRWAASRKGDALWLHATGVAIDGQGIVILGAPGAGKSSLALSLIALGAILISDDGLWLDTAAEPPRLERPETAHALIEARGIGLLNAGPICENAPLAIVIDLDRAEPQRLPPRRYVAIGRERHPLILGAGNNTLAPSLMLMARHGRAEP
jgi:HPr kinase/phosphorylase